MEDALAATGSAGAAGEKEAAGNNGEMREIAGFRWLFGENLP